VHELAGPKALAAWSAAGAADRRTMIGRLTRTRTSLRVDRCSRIRSSAVRAQIVRGAVGRAGRSTKNHRKPSSPNRPRRGEALVAGLGLATGTRLRAATRSLMRKPAFPSWTRGAFDVRKWLFSSSRVSSRKRGATPGCYRAWAPVSTMEPRNKAQMPMFAGTIEETRNGRC
jgi:hypothetical protein